MCLKTDITTVFLPLYGRATTHTTSVNVHDLPWCGHATAVIFNWVIPCISQNSDRLFLLSDKLSQVSVIRGPPNRNIVRKIWIYERIIKVKSRFFWNFVSNSVKYAGVFRNFT